jgi:hypothetical protein
MFTSRHVTADGFEQTFALNHFRPVPAHGPAARAADRLARV